MAQDNNPTGFDWDAYEKEKFGALYLHQSFINTTLTDERKKEQIKILEQRISRLRQRISMYEERKKKQSNMRGRKPKCRTYHYDKRISRYTELINNCLKNIKELETSS